MYLKKQNSTSKMKMKLTPLTIKKRLTINDSNASLKDLESPTPLKRVSLTLVKNQKIQIQGHKLKKLSFKHSRNYQSKTTLNDMSPIHKSPIKERQLDPSIKVKCTVVNLQFHSIYLEKKFHRSNLLKSMTGFADLLFIQYM